MSPRGLASFRSFRVPNLHPGPNARHLADALRTSTVGGILMLIFAGVAIIWASINEPSYLSVTEFNLGSHSLNGWASDGLLTIFFFVAGLELKREFTEGTLRKFADAIVPVMAAIFGMVIPALFYLVINLLGHGYPSGWAIPMATDIAFALAILAIAGRSLPPSLRAFLLTLAVVDDLGSILVIAFLFSHGISWPWLIAAIALLGVWALGQHFRIDNGWLYIPLGIITWWCMLNSGIHATLAGVAMGLLTRNTEKLEDEPLDRWKHTIEPWSAGLAVPIFALFSAGVHINGGLLVGLFTHPIGLGILAGLILGKPIGIMAGTALTVRFTPGNLGKGLQHNDMLPLAQLGGVGLTVALLMCELCFPANYTLREEAKAAVLIASVASSLISIVLLRHRVRTRNRL